MYKKLLAVGIILIFLFLNIVPLVSSFNTMDKSYYFNDFNISCQNSFNVTIYLDKDGITRGQEILWIANTTGTNYEESAVAYIDGIAYISSCSTHGDGYDSLFAVDTINGNILWSKFIGPGYVGPVIDNDIIYIGTDSHGYDPSNQYVYAINRYDGKEIWNRNIYGGIAESIQFDDEKITFQALGYTSIVKWYRFKKIVRLPDAWLLYTSQTSTAYGLIPTSVLDDELKTFIKQKIVENDGRIV